MAPRQPLQDAKRERRQLERYLDQKVVTETCMDKEGHQDTSSTEQDQHTFYNLEGAGQAA